MARPLVNVVIPTYRRAYYLAGAASRALAQTCRDIEFIATEGGSHDAEAEIRASSLSSELGAHVRCKEVWNCHANLQGGEYGQARALLLRGVAVDARRCEAGGVWPSCSHGRCGVRAERPKHGVTCLAAARPHANP